ncbi:MAG: hypothetical protein JXA13_06735 [Anaerolineales bacterium]|nr:hypothetical protein [Anaerolineales bacterium]
MIKDKDSVGTIIDLVFKAVALAMAVAVVVTGVLDTMEIQTQLLLLGIGLFGLAVTELDR